MTKLSIIIPCFNSEQTLEAAVDSVFRQESPIAFNVTMVDDASTDGTYDRMKSVASKYKDVKVVRHNSNRGGGAARNTAAGKSDGELIFCLDSDDMLGPDFLRNITRYWLRKKCDGVGISRSIKFRKFDTNDVAFVTEFTGPGKQVRFESLLDGSTCSLFSTFLVTRKAFERIGGYPTAHAFDTQGMAFRFLGEGLKAYTCPDTVYYHRVGLHQSYYLREQGADRLNWNWFNVLDEFLYLFSSETRSRILEADLFYVPGRPAPPELLAIVRGLRNPYARNYRELIRIGREGVERRFRDSDDGFQQYWLGASDVLKGNYRSALVHYSRALELGFTYRIIYYRILLAALRLSGREMPTDVALEELTLYSRPFPVSHLPLPQRVFRKLIANDALRGPVLWIKALRDRHLGAA